jgi:predicted nuclease with TOPRIM domain
MEELQKMIAEMSLNLKSGLSSMESKLESTQASVDATAQSIQTLNSWKSNIDTQVSDLSSSVDDLRKQVDRMVVGVGLSALGTPPNSTPGAAKPPAPPSTSKTGRRCRR